MGLGGATVEELRALADPRGLAYDPDPRGSLEAREAVSKYYGDRVFPDDLVLTASTSEAYAHLFRILCEPGDEILVPRPSYPLFEPLAALEDVRVEHYRLAYDDRWELDQDSLEAALSLRTRAIVLVQPNNPTGSCLSPSETDAVASLAAERGIALISDEVFGDFPWAGTPLPSMLGETRALTFVLGGLSKACGMPQMKVAWIAARGPDPVRAAALQKLEWIADLFLSVSTPVQLALPRLLPARAPFQRAVRERLATNLARLRALDGARFRLLAGAGGWSAILSAPSDVAAQALERGVLVHPGHFYEAPDDCFVVSLLPEPNVFDEAVSILEISAGKGPAEV